MYDKVFENECDKIIADLDIKDMVSVNHVARVAIKISKKHPLLFLPTFIEDFVSGMPTTHILQKYELLNFNNHATILNSLKLKTRQYKDVNLNVKEQNLQDPDQNKQYQFLSKYTNMLYIPLENRLNHNILQTIIAHSLLNYTYIESGNLQDYVVESYNSIKKEIPILSDADRLISFEKYFAEDLHMKILNITSNLDAQGYAIVRNGNIAVTSEYPNLINHVYNFLNDEKNGIRYATLQRMVLDKFPLLRLVMLSDQIFENILNSLESKNLLLRKKTWGLQSNDHLFTLENYKDMMSAIAKQTLKSGRTKFFGRSLNSELFLDELKSLKLGDLDDQDDQVTWIAGLVLSHATMLQSPRENMPEFDFMVNLKDYDFPPEHAELMKKLDFKINSPTFHCKVMINTVITLPILTNLATALPTDEQGIIFTCKPVSSVVSEIIRKDKSVQIIDENAIRDWCSITPITPCRKNSVARIRYGNDVGKVVLVKSLNYESGLATVDIIPSNVETLIPIGSIEEMLPHMSSLAGFEEISEKYADFLHLLAVTSGDSFEKGLDIKIVGVYDRLLDLKKVTKPELFDENSGIYLGPNLERYDDSDSDKKYIRFENVYAEITISNISTTFHCNCGHRLNEGSYRTLCAHLVAGIVHLCGDLSDAETTQKNIALFHTAMNKIRLDNMKRSVQKIALELGPEKHILESYLRAQFNRHL